MAKLQHLQLPLLSSLGLLALATACGGGGGTETPRPPSALSTTLSNTRLGAARSVTFMTSNVDGTSRTDGRVHIQASADLPGGPKEWLIKTTSAATSMPLPDGTYNLRVIGSDGNVGDFRQSCTIKASETLEFRPVAQNWTINLGAYPASTDPAVAAPDSFSVDVYQCDASGKVVWQKEKLGFADPRVLTVKGSANAITPTTTNVTFTTALHKGTYRAVFIPLKGNGEATGVPRILTPALTIDGTQNTALTYTLPTATSANHLELTLEPNGTTPFADGAFSADLRDRASQLVVAKATLKGGKFTFITGNNVTDTFVSVYDKRTGASKDALVGIANCPNLGSNTQISLRERRLSGTISGAGTIGKVVMVTLKVDSKLNDSNYDRELNNTGFTVALNPTTQEYAHYIFEGAWTVLVEPAANGAIYSQSVTVIGDATGHAAIDAEGTITGTLKDDATLPQKNIAIELLDSQNHVVKSMLSDANGAFSFQVAHNVTYNLLVDGVALTSGLSTTPSAATVTLNLTRYTAAAVLRDKASGRTVGGATIQAGNQTVTANADGAYTLKLFQGTNWVRITPPAGSDLEFLLLKDVVVNANTAK